MSELPVDIDLPDDWEITRPEAGGVNLIARPIEWPGGFVPSITITHTVTTEPQSFDDFVDDQLVGVTDTFADAHIVHLDIAPESAQLDLTLAFDATGLDVTTTQRHLHDPSGNAVIATGIAADSDWAEVAPLLVGSIRSLRRVP